jgi:F0F1-type ATP synthase assembly protein I
VSKYHEEIGRQVAAGVDSAGFFATIMSGFLLGVLLDWLLDTKPVFIVLGIIAGSIIGFWRMWTIANEDSGD